MATVYEGKDTYRSVLFDDARTKHGNNGKNNSPIETTVY